MTLDALSRPRVLRLLMAVGLHAAATTAQASPQARVEASARHWFAAQLALAGTSPLRLDVDVLGPARAPGDCTQPWRVEILDGRIDRLQLVARCPDNDARARYVARARVTARVVVARTDIAAGQSIAPSMLLLAERDITGIGDVLIDPAVAEGRRSRRPLRAGTPLRAGHLHAEAGVRQGQPVRIVGGQPGYQVSIAGTAMADAGLGETVRVRNASSGRIITAIVSAEGTVSVGAPR